MKTQELLERKLGGFTVLPLKDLEDSVAEALKLSPPGQRPISDPDMQAMAGRIKAGEKTPREKMGAYIHASNITKSDDATDTWDLAELKRKITTRPKSLLGTNAKMAKSKTEGEIVYDLTLPALKGIVVDEETGEFVEITTCPSAGACQLYCYARKAGYVMFPDSSMSAARALNFLVNDPDGFFQMVNAEIAKFKKTAAKHGIRVVVRWHDAGDFFSKEYVDRAYDVARANPDVKFYAYTKVASVAAGDRPDNFILNFSTGAKRSDVIQIQKAQAAGQTIKKAITVPKDLFRDLFVTDKNGKYVKDDKGRPQVKSDSAWQQFKQKLAQEFNVDPKTVITYDEMLTIAKGDQPRWNVVVFPAGHGDRAANRRDVINSFLMWH
mgnify:FL=1